MKSALLALTVLFLLNVDADARRRGVAIIGFGEKISDAADLPNETFGDLNLGYYYNSFRLFFIPVVTWDKKYVLHNDTEYGDLTEDEIEELKGIAGASAFRGNLWVKFVNYLWPASVIAFIIFGIVRKRQLARIDEEFSHLR